jgi:hypothetical protein
MDIPLLSFVSYPKAGTNLRYFPTNYKTDERGRFEVSYEPDGELTNNIEEVYIADVQGNEIAAIYDKKSNRDKNGVLNLVLPAKVQQPPEPEYRCLIAYFEKNISSIEWRLASAQEKEEEEEQQEHSHE